MVYAQMKVQCIVAIVTASKMYSATLIQLSVCGKVEISFGLVTKVNTWTMVILKIPLFHVTAIQTIRSKDRCLKERLMSGRK